MKQGRLDGQFSLDDLDSQFILDKYLIGINPCINGEPFPEKFWDHWIRTALLRIEKEAQISIRQHSFKDEGHDYYAQDFQNFCFIQLFNRPIKTVTQVRAVYPTGTNLFTFPQEWIRTDFQSGQIQLVPTQGSLSAVLLGRGGAYLPMLYQTSGYLPGLFQVDYTSGFNEGEFPEDILDTICKRVCIDVLAQLGDLIYGPGVTNVSTSIDGFSESKGIVNNGQLGAVFTSRISQYMKDLYGDPQSPQVMGQNGAISRIKQQYHGPSNWSL